MIEQNSEKADDKIEEFPWMKLKNCFWRVGSYEIAWLYKNTERLYELSGGT